VQYLKERYGGREIEENEERAKQQQQGVGKKTV
jgi:hypothetical protein